MKAAIMQPYFLPYIGYFQLIRAVDVFVVYDNIQYTKKGWINRNRFLLGGSDATFSLPIRKDSDFLDVRQRELAPDFDRAKLLNRLREAYRRAPEFARVFPLLEAIVLDGAGNLFDYVHQSITKVCAYLQIDTPIVVSSTVDIDHSLQAQDKVLAICRSIGADQYVNPIGGQALYSREVFGAQGVGLSFLRSRDKQYMQFGDPFVPWLSIIDVLMFNSSPAIADQLEHGYELI
ncbi:MAG: WbqC family protein [Luteimonas sp.]